MKKTVITIALTILSIVVLAQGQTPIYLDEVKVSTNRYERLLKNTPNIVRVVSKTEIEELKFNSTSEVLEHLAGVNIESGTGSGLPKRGIVSINGYPPSYCLILVNGTRLLSDHVHSGQNIDLIPVNNIERIEVIKGAASSQYGSDALGGIVNVITKDAEGPAEVVIYGEAGNYNTYHGGISVRSRINENISTYTFADWEQSDGVPLIEPAHRLDNMSYNTLSLTQRVEAKLSEKLHSDAWLKYNRNRMAWFGEENYSYLVMPNINFDYELNDDFAAHAKIAYVEWFNETASENNKLGRPEMWINWDISDDNSLLAGFDYSFNEFTRSSVSRNTQYSFGVFAHDVHNLSDNFIIEAGARLDMVEDVDPVVAPQVSLLYKPADLLGLRAGYSRGFHAPSLQELYELGSGHGGAALRFGNPDLKPEYSNSFSFGSDFNFDNKLFIDVSGYYSMVTNMIVPVYEGPWYEVDSSKDVWRRQNILEANIVTGEIGLKYFFIDNYSLHASYTYSDNFTSSEEQRQLPYNPGQSYSIKLTGKQKVNANFEIREFVSLKGVSGRTAWNWKPASDADFDDINGLTTSLNDYQKLDAGITFSFMNNYDFYLNVYNILGQNIQNLDDLLTTIDGEPVFMGGFRLKFK